MAEQIDLEVTAALDGERADKAVAALLGVSRSRASELTAEFLLIDSVEADPSHKVRRCQTIRGRASIMSCGPIFVGIVVTDRARADSWATSISE